MVHLVTSAGLEDGEHLGGEAALQGVRAERTQHHGQESEDGAGGGEVAGHWLLAFGVGVAFIELVDKVRFGSHPASPPLRKVRNMALISAIRVISPARPIPPPITISFHRARSRA